MKRPTTWLKETDTARKIMLECGLTEATKWGLPTFMLDDHNVVILQPFKEYFAVMYFKGALLKDTKKLLIPPGNSQSARQLRFTSNEEVVKAKAIIKSYTKEAMKAEKAGLKVELKKTKDFDVPEEFQKRLDKNKKLKTAFEALTPGRQRAYLYFFSAAKQSATREARIEKYQKQILSGKGMND